MGRRAHPGRRQALVLQHELRPGVVPVQRRADVLRRAASTDGSVRVDGATMARVIGRGAVDWGGTWIRVALVDGRTRSFTGTASPDPTPLIDQYAAITELVRRIADAATRAAPQALGVGVAGIVQHGAVRTAINLGIHERRSRRQPRRWRAVRLPDIHRQRSPGHRARLCSAAGRTDSPPRSAWAPASAARSSTEAADHRRGRRPATSGTW